MIKIDIKGMDQVQRYLKNLSEKGVKYATRTALINVATRIKEAEVKEIKDVFDRPTKYTQNSIFIATSWQAARTENVMASRSFLFNGIKGDAVSVYLKDSDSRGGHYLEPNIYGGPRPNKPYEAKYMGGRFTVPGKGIQSIVDANNGNIPRGLITKMISAYGGFNEMGFNMNKRGKGGAHQNQYFAIAFDRGRLRPGIYERVAGNETAGRVGRYMIARQLAKKKGILSQLNARTKALYSRGVRSVMLFTKQPKYQSRFPFYDVARYVIKDHMASEFKQAMERELALGNGASQ